MTFYMWISVLLISMWAYSPSVQAQQRQRFDGLETVVVPRYKSSPSKSLPPIIMSTIDEAYQKAKQYKQLIAVYVHDKPGNKVPPLFQHRRIAIASRMSLALFVTDYVADNHFFRTRRFDENEAPTVLILDHRGNFIKKLPVTVSADQLFKQTFALRNMETGIESALPKIISDVHLAIEAEDESQLLKITRPWLARHLRGYPEIDEMAEKVRIFGEPKIEEAGKLKPIEHAIERLQQIAKQYQHTPVEAEAKVAIAELHATLNDMASVREICEHIRKDLPWPENELAQQKATRLMRQVRREEMLRRRKMLLEERRKQQQMTRTP